MNPGLPQDHHTNSFIRSREALNSMPPDASSSSSQPPYRRLFPNRYGQLIPPVGSAPANMGNSMSCNDIPFQNSRIQLSLGPQHSDIRQKPMSNLPALLSQQGDVSKSTTAFPGSVDDCEVVRESQGSVHRDQLSSIASATEQEHRAGMLENSGVEPNDYVPQTDVRRCLSNKDLRTHAPLSGSPYSFMLYQKEQISARMTQRLKDSIASPPTRVTIDDSSGSSVGGPMNNRARNQRRAEHNRAVTNELCEIVTDLFVAESKLINPSKYGVDSAHRREQVLRSVERFVGSLPPRYALSAETPSEVLLHMRLVAAVRTDPTRAVVHIMKLENGSHWTLRSEDGRSRKLVTIACTDATSLLEYVTKTLASGGSRVLDADVMLSSDNVVLDRFVVEMHGRLRLDKLSQCIENFLQQTKRKSDSSAKDESQTNRSDSAGSEDSRSHSDISGAVYFRPSLSRNDMLDSREIQEEIKTAVPLSEVVASGNTGEGLPPYGSRFLPLSRHLSIPRTLQAPLPSHRAGEAGGDPMEPLKDVANHRNDDYILTNPDTILKADPISTRRRRSLVNTTAKSDFDKVSPKERSDDIVINEPKRSPENRSGSDSDIEVAKVEESSPRIRQRRPLVKRSGNSDFDAVEQDETIGDLPAYDPTMSETGNSTIPLIPFDELMLIETLGMGRVSTIYRAAWSQKLSDQYPDVNNSHMLALKVAVLNTTTYDTSHVDELRREADISARLRHPNICDLKGVAADSECFCLAYEFCEGGSLLSLLSDTTRLYEYLPIALDIANGMAYLHSRDVIHRDLKPSNILLTRDHRAKIADFGMSIANAGQELTAETGTYRYMAPEVIRHESYSSNADVYSFGVCLWQLISREVPFATMLPVQAAYSVAEGRRPVIPDSTPRRLREIISACWDQDAGRRPSFTYIAMALADYAKMAFSPANVGSSTIQIANEMLANVEGNSTLNVDFTTPVALGAYMDYEDLSAGGSDVGLEI